MIFINFSDGTSSATRTERLDVEVLKRTAQDRVVLGVVGVALLVVMALPRVVDGRVAARVDAQATERAEAEAAAELLKEARERTAELERESQRLAGTLGRIGDLEEDRYDWVQIMDGVARTLPTYSWIEAVELDSTGRVVVRGVAPSLAHVNQYERALGALDLVEQLSLSATEATLVLGTPMVRFAIQGLVRRREARAGYSALSALDVAPQALEWSES
jgi:Tfp pilus assembly protein PilN